MPRIKTVKRAAKKRTKSTSLAIAQKMEKEFMSAPSKIMLHISKEVKSLKQQETKIKKSLAKINAQTKKSENRIHVISKKEMTTARKKQLNVAKKLHAKSAKQYGVIAGNLASITESLETTSAKLAKFVAIGKQLSQFEKDWTKQNKPSKNKKQPALEIVSDSNAKSSHDEFETTTDNVRLNDEVELAS